MQHAPDANEERAYVDPHTRLALGVYLHTPALYPSASIARFLGSLGTRYIATTRLGGGYRHHPAAESPRTGPALVRLLTGVFTDKPVPLPVPASPYLDAPGWLALEKGIAALRAEATLRAWPRILVHAGPVAVHTRGDTHVQTEREVVLDMDLGDWETHRPGSRALLCNCDKTCICNRCWVLAELAVSVCRVWLCDGLGLGPALVVYSGGKGLHMILGSADARTLDTTERAQLAQLLATTDPVLGAARAPPGSMLGTMVEAALVTWRAAIVRRRLLHVTVGHSNRLAVWLKSKAPADFAWPLNRGDSGAAWAAFERAAGPARVAAAVMHLAWPVIDAKVLTEYGHLAKVPFSVHIGTQRVALPLSPAQLAACTGPASMPRAMDLTAGTPDAVALLMEARREFDHWLDACGYPPGPGSDGH